MTKRFMVQGSWFGLEAWGKTRFGGAWSLELELDRAFREKTRTDEAIGFSVAPMNATRAEIERLGVRMRWVRTEKAGLVLIQLTRTITLAPELRYTFGVITDDPYHVVRPGVRIMWVVVSSTRITMTEVAASRRVPIVGRVFRLRRASARSASRLPPSPLAPRVVAQPFRHNAEDEHPDAF